MTRPLHQRRRRLNWLSTVVQSSDVGQSSLAAGSPRRLVLTVDVIHDIVDAEQVGRDQEGDDVGLLEGEDTPQHCCCCRWCPSSHQIAVVEEAIAKL